MQAISTAPDPIAEGPYSANAAKHATAVRASGSSRTPHERGIATFYEQDFATTFSDATASVSRSLDIVSDIPCDSDPVTVTF